jgi:hypothetical protein
MSALIIPCHIKTRWDLDCLKRLLGSVKNQTPRSGSGTTHWSQFSGDAHAPYRARAADPSVRPDWSPGEDRLFGPPPLQMETVKSVKVP